MKTIIIAIAGFALQIGITGAVPHGNHHKLHYKRDYTTDIVTEYTTVLAPEVIVWVDGSGKPVSTETRNAAATTSTPQPKVISVPPAPVSPTPVVATTAPASGISSPTPTTPFSSPAPPSAPSPTSPTLVPSLLAVSAPPPAPSTTEAPASPPPAQTTSAAKATVSPNVQGQQVASGQRVATTAGLGIAYDVLKGGAPGACKTEDEINNDMQLFKDNGYSIVRLYTTSCSQVEVITEFASNNGMKVFISVEDIDGLDASLNAVINLAGSNLGAVDTIAIGNEVVNRGMASAAAVVSAIGSARSILKAKNYSGSIVTVDTFNQLIDHPELCGASDYCAANCHAYFTNSITAENAGAYVQGQVSHIQAGNPNKAVVITESGWPWAGNPNGAAIPSVENQQTAIASIKSAFPSGGVFLFEAFDADYKQPGGMGVEQFFGIYGH